MVSLLQSRAMSEINVDPGSSQDWNCGRTGLGPPRHRESAAELPPNRPRQQLQLTDRGPLLETRKHRLGTPSTDRVLPGMEPNFFRRGCPRSTAANSNVCERQRPVDRTNPRSSPDVAPPRPVPEDVAAPGPASRYPAPELRAGEAGKAFLSALSRDTASFLSRSRRQPRWKVAGPVTPIPPTGGRPEKRRRRAGWRVFTGLVKTVLVLAALAVVAGGGLVGWAVYDVPLDRSAAATTAPSMVLEAADGQSLGRRGPFRAPDVAMADFPEVLINAVLSIEDQRFYSHPGVDFFGIARAFSENLSAGHVVEGGSTITQQLVKAMLGDDERTLRRKLREAMVAVALELRLGKPEILHRYLNSIYMGGGAYGMPAAAQLYFGKAVKDLTVPEAAMLAGIIHAPSKLNPLVNLTGAQSRASDVVTAMVSTGAISAAAGTSAKAQPAVPTRAVQQMIDGTWFADWVADEAGKIAGSNTGPIKVRTTLVLALQKIPEQVVADALAKNGKSAKVSEAALVAMRPDGAVVAMVGGRDYQANQFNRAAQAKRQPGSAFKLFVYLAALRAGYKPDSTVEDAPISIRDPSTGKVWSPENYGGQYSGTVTLANAFAQSLNTAAVRLAVAVGPDKVIQAARPRHRCAADGVSEHRPRNQRGHTRGPHRRLCVRDVGHHAGAAMGHRRRRHGREGWPDAVGRVAGRQAASARPSRNWFRCCGAWSSMGRRVARRCPGLLPARRGRRRTTRMPGSSASTSPWSSASGSATTTARPWSGSPAARCRRRSGNRS